MPNHLLVSYPKSGNTWMRSFIANLLSDSTEPVDINAIDIGMHVADRGWVESALGFDIDELSSDEIDELRPFAYEWLAQQNKKPMFQKVHDAYTYTKGGTALFPVSAIDSAIYIIRNPLDVAVSLSHFSGKSVDEVILNMASSHYSLSKSDRMLNTQLRQTLLSWSEHVNSWLRAPKINKLFVRYEDMLGSPWNTFTRIVQFLELSCSDASIEKAIQNSSLKELQAQESVNLFREMPSTAKQFFRSGTAGQWRAALSRCQIEKVVSGHRDVMTKFGYLHEGVIGRYSDELSAGGF